MASVKMYRVTRALFFLLCVVGILLSLYAYYVETSKERDKAFVAACDISPTISCSKVFTSKYGKGFGLLEHIVGPKHVLNQPNSVFGVVFYLLQVLLGLQHSVSGATLQVVLAVTANLGSVWLAYILYFILHDVCVVCITTYVVNFLILVCTWIRRTYVLERSELAHKKKR